MKAMVLAAGVGSRLDPLTSLIPKPLVPVANVPIMDHIIHLLARHGFNDLIANLHYKSEMILDRYYDAGKFGVSLTFKYEEELTGDAGGVRACKDFFGDETFIVLMGDLLTDCDLTRLLSEHKAKNAIATIAVKKVPDVEHFGVVLQNKDGFITGFQEKPKKEEALSNMASAGIYVLEPKLFDIIPTTGTYGFGRQLFPLLVEKGEPLLAVDIDTYWSDIGTISQYRQSNLDVLQGKIDLPFAGTAVREGVWTCEGANMADNVTINGKLLLGRNSSIGAGTQIHGSVVIGDNCKIAENVVLRNSVIWSESEIGRGATISDSVIGLNSHIPSDEKVENQAMQNREAVELTSGR
ncbi:MAG: NDP-sugar synthase [Cyanobacteria bacterium]|nr:NDP-sugar synthase [Cyanobacteriota bacterium]